MNNRAKAALLSLVGALSGCADSTSAIIQSLRYTIQSDSADSGAKLNPAFRYLRATVRGKSALLVLGYVEPNPQGPIQVWYSAEREVVRIQNGRLVGAVGTLTEWRNVQLSNVPSWSSLAREKTGTSVLRVRDVMPGYRYGVKEVLTIKLMSAPANSALRGTDPLGLTWFEESVEPSGAPLQKEGALPVSRYGVAFRDGAEEVVYGEQCLSVDLCFTWQRWPAGPVLPNESK